MNAEPKNAAVRIELFNGPRVRVTHRPPEGGVAADVVIDRFPRRHSAALLTLLALKPGKAISRDDVADTLWPDEALDASRRRIREHLYWLRKTIPNGRELILSEGDSICLNPAFSVSVDVLEFDSLLKEASETEDGDRKIGLLVQADELYSGPFAPSLDWPRFDALRIRYAGLHLELLRALSLLFAERDFERAIGYGKRAVAAEPLCEGAHEELIRLYARAGRPEDARRQYRDLEKTLKKELAADPSREISELVRGIPAAASSRPLPRLLASLRIAIPSRRMTRVYGAVAALSLTLALVTLLASRPWQRSHAQPPTPTPEQRIAIVQSLRAPASRIETANERDARLRSQADQCLALAEEAWVAWYGRDEQVWIDRLRLVDNDIQESLEWLSKRDPASEIQMSGALTRYWRLPGNLNKNAHWLALVQHDRGRVPDLVKARTLTGLSLCQLGKTKNQQYEGIRLAEEALSLYRRQGDLWGQAHALRHMALLQHSLLLNVESLRNYRDALDLYKRAGSESGQALTYWCLTFFDPNDVPARLTDAQRLEWIQRCSQMYREIANPLGTLDAMSTVCYDWSKVPLSTQTLPGFRSLEGEMREWILINRARNDRVHLHTLWAALGRLALKINDRSAQAGCLLPLISTSPDGTWSGGSRARIVGAYQRYQSVDKDRDANSAVWRAEIESYSRGYPNRAEWDAAFAAGQRMDLAGVVRFAISR